MRWTEEGKHRQAMLGGMGLSGVSVVNSASVQPQEFGQEEDATMLGEAERKKFRSSVATLNYMSLDRSDVQYTAKKICTKLANPTRKLEESEEGSLMISARSGKSDVGDASIETRRAED